MGKMEDINKFSIVNRLIAGEEAIDLSIEKWEWVVEAYGDRELHAHDLAESEFEDDLIGDIARSPLNCALCIIHRDSEFEITNEGHDRLRLRTFRGRLPDMDCGDCLLAKSDNHCIKKGSSYQKYLENPCKETAEEMLDLLRKLRDEVK